MAVEIVRKLPDQVGFQVRPRRWVVERFFAWINRNRRLAKDFEATIASATAFLYAACVMLLTRHHAANSAAGAGDGHPRRLQLVGTGVSQKQAGALQRREPRGRCANAAGGSCDDHRGAAKAGHAGNLPHRRHRLAIPTHRVKPVTGHFGRRPVWRGIRG